MKKKDVNVTEVRFVTWQLQRTSVVSETAHNYIVETDESIYKDTKMSQNNKTI